MGEGKGEERRWRYRRKGKEGRKGYGEENEGRERRAKEDADEEEGKKMKGETGRRKKRKGKEGRRAGEGQRKRRLLGWPLNYFGSLTSGANRL